MSPRLALAVLCCAAAAPAAGAQTPPAAPAPPVGGELTARITSGVADRGALYVARRQKVVVKMSATEFAPGQSVAVTVKRGRRVLDVLSARLSPRGGGAEAEVAFRARRKGTYSVAAEHAATPEQSAMRAKPLRLRAVAWSARPGSRGTKVRVLQRGLRRLGYPAPQGGGFGGSTARAVLAFRKVNLMARKSSASQGVFGKVLSRRGAFKLKYPKAGRHVEADLSRQVLVLARDGRPERTYHMSSGTSATPTVQGSFRFYRKDLGTNGVGMVHSNYFIRGYAIHGYKSVPTGPASHGCLRVPIPSAKSIYDWIRLRDRIFVYR